MVIDLYFIIEIDTYFSIYLVGYIMLDFIVVGLSGTGAVSRLVGFWVIK